MAGRPWTERELMDLDGYLEGGWDYTAIARRLGRSEAAVRVAQKRRGIASRKRRGLSARQVQEQLGVSCAKTVVRWIQAGWLAGQRWSGYGPHRRWYVDELDLLAFLENPAYWHLWGPERITDRALREWATEQRTEKWLTTGQVAERYGVTHRAVRDWIQAGVLSARRWQNWQVPESALTGFIPPYDRDRSGIPQRRFRRTEDALLLALRRAGLGWTEIARHMNRSISSVFGRYQRLQSRQEAA